MRCSARSKRSGVQCRRHAAVGATVCAMHGGSAGQVKRAAAARVATEQAMQALDRLGAGPVSNPLEALQQLAGEVLAVKDYLGNRVAVLEELRYRGVSGEQLRGELVAYERALDRSVRALAEIARLNIDERLARIDEAQTREYLESTVAVLDAALHLLLPPRDHELCKSVVAFILRAVGSSALVDGRVEIPPLTDDLAGRVRAFQDRLASAERVPGLERDLAQAQQENQHLRDLLARVHRPRGELPAARPPETLAEQLSRAGELLEPDEVLPPPGGRSERRGGARLRVHRGRWVAGQSIGEVHDL